MNMQKKMETIYFYHTNDIHSHFDTWPQISRYLISKRAEHKEREETCLVFDIGDHVDRSHPFTDGTAGKGNVALLNSAGYDAITIGNNEGITMSKKALNTLYEGANFDVIICNLFETDDSTPKWMKPYEIYTTVTGLKIGVIGATAQYKEFYAKLDWRIVEPREALQKIAKSIRPQVDMIVCLSHLGIHEDRLLAAECKEIDVIFGAHTHHLLMEGECVDSTLLAATGKFGQYVGKVVVQFDIDSGRIANKHATIIPASELESEEADVERVNRLIEDGKQSMDEKVFYNPFPLKNDLFKESPLSSFFGKSLIAYTDADCALFNGGLFLGGLEQGWVTKADLHALLPHPINLCVVQLKGTELLEIIRLSKNEEWPKTEIKGLGFRGTLMGALIFANLHETESGQLFAGQKEVLPETNISLATLDMFTFGFFFPTLKDAEKDYIMPEFIRDVLGWYGKETFAGTL
ncbi:bifunctional UDP-sugar hydrolase/5'-nucleotidase [Sporosarcina sp. USHLN248]|uniref:bifunctional metallophosphatase/5'-nucleotidase n=1 Tax=Sporosarcina sp. USHLN248 TaxID=3081300 RepID=UPI0030198F35